VTVDEREFTSPAGAIHSPELSAVTSTGSGSEDSRRLKMGRPKGTGKGCQPHVPLPMSERISTFWSRVDKKGPDDCWPWLGAPDIQTGYGKFSWNSKTTSAHRFAWIATFGEIPSGLHVLHHCDNRICQNPNHLFVGTNTDNVHDMLAKGRASKPPVHTGPRRWNCSPLSVDDVKIIRSMWIPRKFSVRKIAVKLGLPYKSVENAVSKHHWKGIL
jgi:hypothetical protein